MADPRGPEIADADAEVHRRVPEAFLHDGQPGSDAFKLRATDEGLLSVSDGRKRSRDETLQFWRGKGLSVGAVASVRVGAVHESGLKVYEDPEPADVFHAVIDLRGFTSNAARRKGSDLRDRCHGVVTAPPL